MQETPTTERIPEAGLLLFMLKEQHHGNGKSIDINTPDG